jgi:protein TonB
MVDIRHWAVSLCVHAAVLFALLLGVADPIPAPAPLPMGPPFRMVAAPAAAPSAPPSRVEPKPAPSKPPVKPVMPPKPQAKAQVQPRPAAVPTPQPAATSNVEDSLPASVSASAGNPAPANTGGGGDAVPTQLRPAYLNNPIPEYPLAAKRRGIEGRVLVHAEVDEHGLPSVVKLARSSGSEMLDNAAVEAVKRWRFSAASQGGRSVRASVVIPITFQLSGTVISAIN